MSLTFDKLICEMGSQSSPDKKYQIRLRKDDEGHCWLSCGCPSWITGPYQKGKKIYERTCKHIDRTIIEMPRELAILGYVPFLTVTSSSLNDIAVITQSKKFEPVKTGLSRKVRK